MTKARFEAAYRFATNIGGADLDTARDFAHYWASEEGDDLRAVDVTTWEAWALFMAPEEATR